MEDLDERVDLDSYIVFSTSQDLTFESTFCLTVWGPVEINGILVGKVPRNLDDREFNIRHNTQLKVIEKY